MEDNYDEVLVVHLGGLGDICLAESVFFSLRRHFGDCLTALGNRRFFDLFGTYFTKTCGVESRHWLYLFSEKLTGPRWRRIVFIGKDRQGDIRRRWASYSREDLIFIDMYPDGSFPDPQATIHAPPGEAIHIEEYQLRQLEARGIAPEKAGIIPAAANRTILYPEKGFTKEKWAPENFIALANFLTEEGIDPIMLKPAGLDISCEALAIPELADVRNFFSEGGVFISNDSGMAHLAGVCGLSTITIFSDFEPAIWHPRGRNISLKQGVDAVNVPLIARIAFGFADREQMNPRGSNRQA